MSIINLEEILIILLSSILLTVTLVIPLQSLPKISSIFNPDVSNETVENFKSEVFANKSETENKDDSKYVKEVSQIKRPLIAHREVLEEIPEVEVEYEMQRESHDGLEEILEEDDALDEEQDRLDEEDLEIIEEEQGEDNQEDDFWADREENVLPRRSLSNNQDIDEWEWTANGNERGNQHYRYSR